MPAKPFWTRVGINSFCLADEGQRLLVTPRKVKIDVDSSEAQIVADFVERSGASVQQATDDLNKHMILQGLPLYSVSAVQSLIERLQPQRSYIQRKKQGTYDKESPWAIRRLAQTTQLLLRTGKPQSIVHEKFYTETVQDGDGNSTKTWPPFLDAETLQRDYPVDLEYVAFWDESHRQCVIGSAAAMVGRNYYTLKFKRDEDGKLDLNGDYDYKSVLWSMSSMPKRQGLNLVLQSTGTVMGILWAKFWSPLITVPESSFPSKTLPRRLLHRLPKSRHSLILLPRHKAGMVLIVTWLCSTVMIL